jgi:hypothetical protein
MKKFLTLTVFILIGAVSHSQNNGAFMIPRIVYVGDEAALVLPLAEHSHETYDVVLSAQSPNLPNSQNIDFHKITLERRLSGNRLVIEFTAFAPGILELPEIEIDGEYFSGLTVMINSIIDTAVSAPGLSRPASSLAMPGTAVMLYGIMAASTGTFLLVLWFVLKGRRYLQIMIERWKHWRLFVSFRNTERHLHKLLLKGGNKRDVLDRLSAEFRVFLSFFTGVNCRSMTAREFEFMPKIDSYFLGNFFRRCDTFRFSGADTDSKDILGLLDDLRHFVAELENNKPAEGAA